jgi:carboxymethylenebutenolidase
MMKRRLRVTMSAAAAFAVVALSLVPAAQQIPPDGKSWVGHTPRGVRDPNLPPDEDAAKEQLAKSMLKSEWVSISMSNGPVLKAFIVHPELTRLRPRAGVVIVIHDNLGLTDWVRGVADQLARHGFIAVAPDLLSGKGPNGGGTDTLGGGVGPAIDGLTQDEVIGRLNAVREYGAKIATGTGRVATMGFGWGGGMSFVYALRQPLLNGAVSVAGPISKDPAAYANPRVRILGLYGSADPAINENIPIGEATLGNLFNPHVFINASHEFMRLQKDQNGENLNAVILAWPEAISFLQGATGGGGGRGGEA